MIFLIIVFLLVFLSSCRELLDNQKEDAKQAFKSVWKPEEKATVMRTLQDGIRILKSHGIEMVAVYGTLIGVLRHEGIIPWDDDLDFAISEDQKELLFSLKEELASSNIGLVQVNGNFAKLYPLDHPPIDSGKYPWSWPFIDIFYYKEDGDYVLLYDVDPGGIELSKSDVLPFKKELFESIYVNVPNNSEKILSKMYGNNWKDICISSSYNHRLEKARTDVHKLRCQDVKKMYRDKIL